MSELIYALRNHLWDLVASHPQLYIHKSKLEFGIHSTDDEFDFDVFVDTNNGLKYAVTVSFLMYDDLGIVELECWRPTKNPKTRNFYAYGIELSEDFEVASPTFEEDIIAAIQAYTMRSDVCDLNYTPIKTKTR